MKFTLLMIWLISIPLLAEDPNKEGKTKKVNTPFGPSTRSAEDKDAPAKPRPTTDDPMLKIEETGDTVTFRRQTPFGEQVWRRKRSELNEVEKELMAARKRAATPAPTPASSAASGSNR